jgi:glycerol-3-phosphate dehydrogenase
MIRDVEALARAKFDLLVIGGGIHGLFAAYDAATRGLSVALVERGDFGSGLSFNHQRTIHGGLRALQTGRLGKARQQIFERRTWARIAPHLVRPLPFLFGTYRGTRRSRWVVRCAFAAYDRLGRSRNRDVTPELHLPHCRLESRAATKKLFPGITEKGLSGGAVWYDYQAHHPDRLLWTVALAASGAGATLVNYVDALRPTKAAGRVTGATVRDVASGRELDVTATVTLIAAGSGLPSLADAFGIGGAPPLVRAMNVLLDRPARDLAIAATGASGHMLTAVPWRRHLLAGTYQSNAPVEASERDAPATAVDDFLVDLNSAFPALGAKRRDIRLVHHGLTPAVVSGGRTDLLPEPQITRHASSGVPGVISLVGVKFTTARSAAEKAIGLAASEAGRTVGASRTATETLPFAEIADVEGRLVEALQHLGLSFDRDIVEHLASWYGTEAPVVVEYASKRGAIDRITADSPVISGELAYATEYSSALRLADVVLRRTPLGAAGHPGTAALARAADVMGHRLGWDDGRKRQEIEEVARRYAI